MEIKLGTTFVGNVNGAVFEVVKIEKITEGTDLVKLKDCKTGKVFTYGLDALKRCSIRILE